MTLLDDYTAECAKLVRERNALAGLLGRAICVLNAIEKMATLGASETVGRRQKLERIAEMARGEWAYPSVAPPTPSPDPAGSPPEPLTVAGESGRVDGHSETPADSAAEVSCPATKGPWT